MDERLKQAKIEHERMTKLYEKARRFADKIKSPITLEQCIAYMALFAEEQIAGYTSATQLQIQDFVREVEKRANWLAGEYVDYDSSMFTDEALREVAKERGIEL